MLTGVILVRRLFKRSVNTMLPNINETNKIQKTNECNQYATSPFGNAAQNELCESIFLNQEKSSNNVLTDEMIRLADKTAKDNKADVITESFKNIDGVNFSFDTEKEVEDCSGMEITHYIGNINGNVEVTKSIFLKYISKNSDTSFSQEDMQELDDARNDAKGALNILSALIDSSDEKTKSIFQAKKDEVEKYLARYDNFFQKSEKV